MAKFSGVLGGQNNTADTEIDLSEDLLSGDWSVLAINGIMSGSSAEAAKRFRIRNPFSTIVLDTGEDLTGMARPFTVLIEKKVDRWIRIEFIAYNVLTGSVLYSKTGIFRNGVPQAIILNGSAEGSIEISDITAWLICKDPLSVPVVV